MTRRLIALIAAAIVLFSIIPAYAEEGEGLEPVAAEKGSTYVVLSWNDTGSESYSVARYINGTYCLLGTVSETEYLVEGLKPGCRYSFRIIDKDSEAKVSLTTRPAEPSNVALKNLYGKKASVTWSCKAVYTGFQVRYSKNESFSSYNTVTTESKKIYLEKLKKNTTYYVKVRAFKDNNGKKDYGQWSEVKSFTYHALSKSDGKTYMDGILIVNKTYSLPSSYKPGFRKTTNDAYYKLKNAAAKAGVKIYINSGYRSYSYQKGLYSRYLKSDPRSVVDTYSARAGHSEHQSGYAIDLGTTINTFEGSKADKWVKKNCYKYGFIIRYPEGKSDKTGYMYEPWHLRYVGEELAKELYNDGDWITLEEHFGITSKYK